MKKTLATLLAVLLLLVCLSACGGGNLFASGPEATVQQFIDSINNNDVNGLAGCYEPSYQELVKASMNLLLSTNEGMTLAEMMGFGSEKLGLEVQNVAIDGDSAIVTADFTLGSMTNTADLPLKQVDGKWYIDTAEVLNSFTSMITGEDAAVSDTDDFLFGGSSGDSSAPAPSSSPEDVLIQYIDAINADDYMAMSACYEPDYQELLISGFEVMEQSGQEIDLSMMMANTSSQFELTIESVNISGDTAVVTATLSYDGYADTDDVPFVCIDGQWYIDGSASGI